MGEHSHRLRCPFFNTTGTANTANGVDALAGNTSGGDNTATGFDALAGNHTGSFKAGTGCQALNNNNGNNNTATGPASDMIKRLCPMNFVAPFP
jgi:hypothetical protein